MAGLQRFVLAACLGALIACPAWSNDHLRADSVVATVGETEITLGHLIAMVRNLPQEQLRGTPEENFANILERLVQQEAVAQQQSAITPLTELQLENERRSLLASQEVERIFNDVVVTEEDIQSAYDAAYGDFMPITEYNASHILVDTEDEALVIVEELRDGADFAATARAKSTGPSGPGGGSLGWFGPGRMVPAFETAVVEMEIGEISDPVQTQFGWHVILLNDKRVPSVPTLDETRDQLEGEVTERLFLEQLQATISSVSTERADLGAFDPNIIFDTDLIGN